MDVITEDHDGTTLVKARESRIDAAIAIQFKDRMREVIEASSGRLILDLSSVDFVDSSGLGAIVAAMKMAGSTRKLELSGLTPTVMKVFHLTRMDSVFTIHSSVEAALGVAENAD